MSAPRMASARVVRAIRMISTPENVKFDDARRRSLGNGYTHHVGN